jgi:hypothetical protein
MKMTLEIADPSLEAARKAATWEGATRRARVALELRQLLESRKQGEAFSLRNASLRGGALRHAAKGLSWEQTRELVYGERGR